MEKLLPDTNSSETNPVVSILGKVIQFSLLTFVAFSMFSISITQVSFSLGALAWLFKAHLTKSWKEQKGTWVGIAILCFFLASVLSTTSSVDFKNSLGILKKLIQFVIFFWVVNTVQDEKQRGLIVKLLIISGVVATLHGLYPQLEARTFSPLWSPRAQGTMSAPSSFSAVLMLTGLLALGRFLYFNPKQYWVLVSFALINIAILYTQTRQAWLGMLIGIIYILFFWNKKYLPLVPLLCVCLLLFAPPNIKNRMLSLISFQDTGLQERIYTWKGGWKIFMDHPITGCGYKCVDSIYSQYPDPSGKIARYRGMHNNFVQLLIDTGIVGMSLWVSIWVAYFIEIFKRWKILDESRLQDNARDILAGCSAGVLAYVVAGSFESSIYDSEVSMLIYFLMGLSLAKVKKAPETS
jgi:O-antigen ligase